MKIKVHWCSVVSFCLTFLAVLPLKSSGASVNISGFAYLPPNLEITVGDTVTWSNSDSVPHTATSNDNSWDTGFLNEGQSATLTFKRAGTYDYFCGLHPEMVARLVVRTAQAKPPTVTITSPANNTTLAQPGSVTIEATATGNGGATITQVEFFDNGISVGIDTMSPYSVTVNLAAGSHSLTARATDSNNASTLSAAVTVTVGAGGTRIEDPIVPRLAKGNITIGLQTILNGLISPLGMAAPDDGTKRLFVYDQAGLVYVVANGVKLAEPFLDVRERMVTLNPQYDERGLLGLATHPDFANKPFVYTYTSEPVGAAADFPITGVANNHQSVIAEWRIDAANANRIDPASRREIMRIDQPQGNHNAGTMRFGPDGFLYVVIGDGGAADDQGNGHSAQGNGQDMSRILGKLIRIDVDGRISANGQYAAPADNPFVGQAGVVPEIWASGLRNPFSFSFQRGGTTLWLADVGQNDVEEVNVVPKGANLGWRIKEGTFFFDPNGTEEGFVTTAPVVEVPAGLVDPVAQYDHDEGQAIIGGYAYTGASVTALSGKYVTGDWGMFDGSFGRLFYLDGSELNEFRIGSNDRPLGMFLKGFGEDQDGELYVFGSTTLGPTGTTGLMLKIVPAEITITEVTREGNSLTIRWSGGVGPFRVLKKVALEDANWTIGPEQAENSAVLTIDGNSGFFQVQGN